MFYTIINNLLKNCGKLQELTHFFDVVTLSFCPFNKLILNIIVCDYKKKWRTINYT